MVDCPPIEVSGQIRPLHTSASCLSYQQGLARLEACRSVKCDQEIGMVFQTQEHGDAFILARRQRIEKHCAAKAKTWFRRYLAFFEGLDLGNDSCKLFDPRCTELRSKIHTCVPCTYICMCCCRCGLNPFPIFDSISPNTVENKYRPFYTVAVNRSCGFKTITAPIVFLSLQLHFLSGQTRCKLIVSFIRIGINVPTGQEGTSERHFRLCGHIDQEAPNAHGLHRFSHFPHLFRILNIAHCADTPAEK